MSPQSYFSPAKINLTLHVSAPNGAGEKYAGYHRLDSLVAFSDDIGDVLHFSPARQSELIIHGRFAENLLPDENNIILKALRLVESHIKKPLNVRIELEKNLPIASGIGGGSGNAAATIKGLNNIFELGLDETVLHDIAVKIGADVPACLNGVPIIMRNIGDEFVPAPYFPDLAIVLANPLIECSTPLIYQKFDELADFDFAEFAFRNTKTADEFCDMIALAKNNLECANFSIYPQVAQLTNDMKNLEGVKLVRMSGSGGSVFAIFENINHAQAGAETLHEIYNNQIWSIAGTLAGNHE
jgi:4-diphosphocytidyl-2-C-methyl-D-erythritol kinase